MEDFVSYELAVKLKEKEFNYPCIGHYVNNQLYVTHYQNAFHSDNDESVDAPTISQILKWLRKEKEVDLVIEPIFIYDENKRREYGVRVFAPQLNKPINCGYFNTWDDASTAGIEYIINNNLI